MCFPTYGLNLAIGLRIGLGLKKRSSLQIGPLRFLFVVVVRVRVREGSI